MDKERIFRGSPRKKGEKNSGLFKTQEARNKHPTNKRENLRNMQLCCQTTCTHRWGHRKRELPGAQHALAKRKRKRPASLGASLAIRAEGGGFEPPVPIRVRQFSKLVVSATHPSFLSDYSVRSFPAVIGVQMYATNLFSANIFATKYCRMAFSR